MADPTVNPYGFVPLTGAQPARERAPEWHRIAEGAYSGALACVLEAVTPLFTADHQKATQVIAEKRGRIFPFLRNGAGEPIVQGTSLKGMVRAVFEASYPSCLPLAAASGLSEQGGKKTPYAMSMPAGFAHSSCGTRDSLCPACRLFGVIQGEEVHLRGRVAFGDAVLSEGKLAPGRVLLRELSSPKPHHYAIYSATAAAGGPIRGRKLYLHQENPAPPAAADPRDAAWSTRSSALAEVAPAEAKFKFRIVVENLTEVELCQLIACLQLDEGHAHKIGMAKPLGYGSCRIRVLEDESRIHLGTGRYRSLGGQPVRLPDARWSPAAELEALLRLKLHGGETIGYLPYNSYKGIGIDARGKYRPVTPTSRAAPAPPPEVTKREGGAGVTLEDLYREKPSKRAKPAKPIAKNAPVRVRVVEKLGEERFLLEVRDREQEDVVFEGSVPWKVGDLPTVRAVKVDSAGNVTKVRWP